MKTLSYILLFAVAFTSCQTDTSNAKETAETAEEQTNVEPNTFGEAITAEGSIPLSALTEQLSSTDTAFVKVKGRVDAVCQKKGCWMSLTDIQNPEGESIFVKFKDYGFFVPKDLAGSDVVMSGKAYATETPVDELRHYAEDEGKSAEEIAAITEPKKEYNFMADGVVITKRVEAQEE
jgi:hypothetical protein